MAKALIFLGLLAPQNVHLDRLNWAVIWDVGQGQWITLTNATHCYHIDMGGQQMPPKKHLLKLCGRLKNKLLITHWDWDHISLIKRTHKILHNLCREPIRTPVSHYKKSKMVLSLPDCDQQKPTPVERLMNKYILNRQKQSNDRSEIFFSMGVLILGDSSHKLENNWVPQHHNLLQKTRLLIVGHHGSKTSTGHTLLKRLPNNILAIASADSHRYGHPHLEVRARLKNKKTPLITTHTWGNIWIPINQ